MNFMEFKNKNLSIKMVNSNFTSILKIFFLNSYKFYRYHLFDRIRGGLYF